MSTELHNSRDPRVNWITDRDLADAIGKSLTFVQAQCRTKRWPHLKIGRSYRFTPEHVAGIAKVLEVPAAAETVAAQSWGRRKRGA